MKRTECFGRPGIRKRGPRPAPWPAPITDKQLRESVFTIPEQECITKVWSLGADPFATLASRKRLAWRIRWTARLRSFGGWLMSSRFAPLRSLGGRLLRTGALFSWLPK